MEKIKTIAERIEELGTKRADGRRNPGRMLILEGKIGEVEVMRWDAEENSSYVVHFWSDAKWVCRCATVAEIFDAMVKNNDMIRAWGKDPFAKVKPGVYGSFPLPWC